jgi:predicted TPR repeat methyltransferase
LNALDLYAVIEEELGFNDEIQELYQFYLDFASQHKVNSLLDIGCGQGNFLKQLSDIHTLGIDLSQEQINICQQKGLNAKCIDVNKLDEKFQMATAVFDVVNYLDTSHLELFLQGASNTLTKNGYFLFDINTLYGFEEIAEGSLNINKKDKFIAIDAYFEENKLTTNINLFTKDNNHYRREENHITQYYHSKQTLKSLMKKCGFQILKIVNFHLHSEDEADKQIYILQKIK